MRARAYVGASGHAHLVRLVWELVLAKDRQTLRRRRNRQAGNSSRRDKRSRKEESRSNTACDLPKDRSAHPAVATLQNCALIRQKSEQVSEAITTSNAHTNRIIVSGREAIESQPAPRTSEAPLQRLVTADPSLIPRRRYVKVAKLIQNGNPSDILVSISHGQAKRMCFVSRMILLSQC